MHYCTGTVRACNNTRIVDRVTRFDAVCSASRVGENVNFIIVDP